jgi:TolB-like protein/Flp pilus assembly protein TadD
VGPEAIFSQVWPNVVVGDNALYRCIAQIRKVLGDSAAEPHYIVTVPKRGYRLIADVNAAESSQTVISEQGGGTEAISSVTIVANPGRLLTPRRMAFLAGGLLFVVLTIALHVLLVDDTPRDAVEVRHGRLTSIAVLPFNNVSDQPGNKYFAFGLSDEILSTLGQVKGLDVVARHSSYSVGDMEDVREIGKRLNVKNIVEGTVRKAGNKIRVNVQLIDTGSGFDMWSGEYDRNLDDVFAVQEEIAESILEALSKQLDIALNVDVPAPNVTKLEAFDLYLLGRHYLRTREPADLARAVSLFQKAIRHDESYAPAYAGLAEAYLLQAEYGDLTLDQAIDLAEPMISKALALDETLAEGHAALGLSRFYERRYEEAQDALRSTIQLNPSHALANMWLGLTLAYHEGRIGEGQQHYERAQSLDPLNVTLVLNIAYNLSRLGHYAEALERLEAASELHPRSVWIQLGIAQVAADFGRFDVAHGAAGRALKLRPESARAMTMLAYVYAHVDDLGMAEHWIERTEQSDAPTSYWHLNMAKAAVYLQRGEFEALAAFLKAQTEHRYEPDPLLFFSPQLWHAYGAAGTAQMLVEADQEAAEYFERFLQSIGDHHVTQLSEDNAFFLGDFAYVNKRMGEHDSFDRILAEAVSVTVEARQNGWNTNLLTFYEARLRVLEGDRHKALAGLEQAIDDGYAALWWLEVDPIWDEFRSDERFRKLVTRVEDTLRESRRHIGDASASIAARPQARID